TSPYHRSIFTDSPATTALSTLSLHDAMPASLQSCATGLPAALPASICLRISMIRSGLRLAFFMGDPLRITLTLRGPGRGGQTKLRERDAVLEAVHADDGAVVSGALEGEGRVARSDLRRQVLERGRWGDGDG